MAVPALRRQGFPGGRGLAMKALSVQFRNTVVARRAVNRFWFDFIMGKVFNPVQVRVAVDALQIAVTGARVEGGIDIGREWVTVTLSLESLILMAGQTVFNCLSYSTGTKTGKPQPGQR
jgi:hypothetical protein